MHQVTASENGTNHVSAFFKIIIIFFFYRFTQGSPLLSEFESQILFYRDLELEINSEPEYITVGALALFTGQIELQFFAGTVTSCLMVSLLL